MLRLGLATAAMAAFWVAPGFAFGQGEISGTVRGEGSPLEEARVVAERWDDVGASLLPTDGPKGPRKQGAVVEVAEDQTDDQGAYEIGGLPAGEYYIRFEPPQGTDLAPQYYAGTQQGVQTRTAAQKIVITETVQSHPGIDANLLGGREITGTVTRHADGQGVEGICVTAEPLDSDLSPKTVESDGDGAFTIDQLPANGYLVQFDACDTTENLVTEWFADAFTVGEADTVDLVEETAADLGTIGLDAGAVIVGHVTAGETTPIQGATVYAHRIDGPGEYQAKTDGNGNYAITRLPEGMYIVEFVPPQGSGFGVEYWNNAPGPILATEIELALGEVFGQSVDADFEEDDVPPTVEIVPPPTLTSSPSLSISFSVDDPRATLECVLRQTDRTPPTELIGPCTSETMHETGTLPDGRWELEVHATDAAGNTGSDAVGFTIDTQVTLEILGGPSGKTTETRPRFDFSAEPGSDVECWIASPGHSNPGPCTSSAHHLPPAPLAPGNYEFGVRATDLAGNTITRTRSFQVVAAPPPPPPADATPPSVRITSGPAGRITQRRARFGFTSDDPTATFVCSLDGAPEKPCTSPTTTKRLKKGKHVFAVSAVDQAGNRSTETRKFKVKPKKKKKKRKRRRRGR